MTRDLFARLPHPCLHAISALASVVGAECLARGPLRKRFARGAGFGPGYLIRGYGVTGRGETWGAAAEAWLQGAKELTA